jgi:hypothetical protein
VQFSFHRAASAFGERNVIALGSMANVRPFHLPFFIFGDSNLLSYTFEQRTVNRSCLAPTYVVFVSRRQLIPKELYYLCNIFRKNTRRQMLLTTFDAVNQSVPKQEPGIRPARALPYTLNAHGLLQLSDGSFLIVFENTGTATAVFQARSGSGLHIPRTYTVEPGKSLRDTWPLASIGVANCDLSVYGPNGFFRGFNGRVSALRTAQLDVRAYYNGEGNGIANPSSQTANVIILDQYTGERVQFAINAGRSDSKYFSLSRFSGWYDFVIKVASDSSIQYHFAGHAETGKDSISDPALSGSMDSDDDR